jgi:hypothetical protein
VSVQLIEEVVYVFVGFIDNGGIVGHHYLSFLFTTEYHHLSYVECRFYPIVGMVLLKESYF